MKSRIHYIDRLKGFAILLVIMGHVYGMAFDLTEEMVYKVICSFHMPLFMFLSGLVASSGITAPYWDRKKMVKKVRGLLLPLFVFGMCFTMTFANDFCSGLIGFLESPNKNGYWYLMTLAVFYLSLYVFRLNVKCKWYVDVALAIVTWGGYFVLWKYMAQRADYFCLLNCGNFYLFFILGAFCTKYGLTDWLMRKSWLVVVAGLLGYFALFGYVAPIHAVQSLIKHIALPMCALMVVVPLFVRRESGVSYVERGLEYIGRSTLDIYVLHYFLISILKDQRGLFPVNVSPVFAFLMILSLSLFISILCLWVGKVLHRSRWIEMVVYGHF